MTQVNRKVIRVGGSDARSFLQGLITNDVDKLETGLVYTAFLTPQGKYRADFFLVPDGDNILIDIDADLAGPVVQTLSMYKLRSDVTLEETDLQVTRGLGDVPEGAFADPRDASLGWRGYAGQPGTDTDWEALHVAACVPQSGIELTPDTFILEAGFERLNGVDFRKGCYVGQEVTARMKHKTELRKGLTLVEIDGVAAPGSDIMAGEKPAGTLFTQSGGKAMAYLRFDRAKGDLTAGDARIHWAPPAKD
ncbi:MAG: folate-binding protein [Pelagimonas sp.]|jgi:folate-binding protein YgfZ|nr:folate-binding protein [Pelagimonas sp.]